MPHTEKSAGNRLLQQLSQTDRQALLRNATEVLLPVGFPIARVGDLLSTVFFPDAGVVSVVSETAGGHHLAVGVVGAEGVLGLEVLFERERHDHTLRVIVEAPGWWVPAYAVAEVFQGSRHFRDVVLAYVGVRMRELTAAAVCNRVHSLRQRLARWLFIVSDKAGDESLPVTHDALAQMVGGQRHAVTGALNDLKRKGALTYQRGRIDVLDHAVLGTQSCGCYMDRGGTALYRRRK